MTLPHTRIFSLGINGLRHSPRHRDITDQVRGHDRGMRVEGAIAASPVALAQTVVSKLQRRAIRDVQHGGVRVVAQPADDDAARAVEPDELILRREQAGRNAPLPTGQQHWSLSYKARAHLYKTRVL